MATLGHIDAFDAAAEQWSSYTERLTHYYIANGIVSDDKKRSILLTVCGAATYQLIRDLLSPNAVMSSNYIISYSSHYRCYHSCHRCLNAVTLKNW